MIEVQAVLELKLPISFVRVGRLAGNVFNRTDRALVDNKIDKDLGFAKMIVKRRDVRIEAFEQKNPKGVEKSDLNEVMVSLGEARGVLASLLGCDEDIVSTRII